MDSRSWWASDDDMRDAAYLVERLLTHIEYSARPDVMRELALILTLHPCAGLMEAFWNYDGGCTDSAIVALEWYFAQEDSHEQQ